MCLYTPAATKKKSHGSSSYASKPHTSHISRDRHRQPLPRNIIVNQPAPVPPPAIPQYPPHHQQQPRIEIAGEGETTNIYLPSPAPPSTNQFQGQNGGAPQMGNGQMMGQSMGMGMGHAQNGHAADGGRKSSLIVSEVEGVMRLARRVGDAVRKGSASSFGRGGSYRHRERSRERTSHRHDRHRNRSDSSSRSRSRSRERRRADSGRKELRVVDEEARQLARYAGDLSSHLYREKEVKREAKRMVERKRDEEERLADRVLSRYGGGAGGGMASPPRGGGRDWRESITWSPYHSSPYGVAPPPPPPPAGQTFPAQSHNSGGGNSNNFRDSSQRQEGGRDERPGSNHIHVHTAPLVQGPQISTSTPGASGGYAEMPGMLAGANASARRGSWVEPVRRLMERSMGGYGAGMGVPAHLGMGLGGMGMGMGMGGVGGVANVVPIGEREWQRARVFSSHAGHGDAAGLGGMMY